MHFEPIKIASDVFIETKYTKGQADIYLGKYVADRSYAIVITEVGQQAGGVIATPTKCLVDYDQTPPEGCCWIANYSENEGMALMLEKLGIIAFEGQRFEIHNGASWSLCRVLKTEAV